MAECVVWCAECRTEDGGSRRWRHLCEECAEEQLWRHKTSSGHEPWMVVVSEPSVDLVRTIRKAARWWE